MYQIKRCSAPCVERISAPDYRDLVTQARRFLTGNSKEVQQQLAAKMEEAAGRLDFEAAAVYRDRIRALSQIQAHQDINIEGVDNADVIARSEEHTSELQSLMRISYAVFCLKKKNNHHHK